MAEAIGSCLEPLFGCLESTGMLDAAAREVATFVRIKSNWGDLVKARDSLQAVKTTVGAGVAAEEDKLNICDPQVQLWLKRVDELQLDTIDEDYGNLVKFSCFGQCTLHASHRASIGKRVVEVLDEVNKLTEEGKGFKKFGFKPPPEIVDLLPQIETFGLESMLNQLHDLLEKGESNIIGVWGQGGIGKTTLLHVFNNNLEKKAGNYQVVIFIEVSNSKTLNTVEIQQTISERLNLPWNESDTVEKRAKFLIKALARKRFVVLLDDVRKKFRLEDVGIPNPDTNRQSKLILTSRDQDVCFQMGAQRSLIKMQILDSDAAWKLFLSKLSTEVCAAISSNNVIREHAKAICLGCGGLPLALNVIGTAMAGLEGPKDWISVADAIKANMDNFPAVDDMFSQLKYSYDNLTPTQQQCFLYSTLFPEYGSISKEQLVDYWLAEGLLLNDCEKGYQIIRSLISACLLQASNSMSSKVKMHHVIRHLGFWLASKTDQKFLVRAGMALDSAPSAEKWKGVTRISIMSNDIKELSFSPKCRSLTTLLIQNNPNLKKLSQGFFKFMPSLKVLDLSRTAITSLPECETLVALQHLNLSHTLITRLPERLWLLKELRHLDVSVTVALEDTLNNCSKLLKLRVLNLFRSHYGIHDVDDLNLDSLKELMFLGITIYAEDVLKKLNKTSPLAKSTYRLNLKYCGEMHSIKISDLNHLLHLEELYVESCYDLNTLVADAELTTSGLELLTLSVLPSLENIIVAPMPHHFRHVRKLVISMCPKLRDITWVLKLELLERLVITHCDGILKIVEEGSSNEAEAMPDHPSEEQEDDADEWSSDGQSVGKSESTDGEMHSGFSNLRSIILTDVKKLRSICKPRDFPSLETIRVEDCPNLRSIPLSSTYNCRKLKQVCGSVEWWGKLEWEDDEDMDGKLFIPI
ncbi:disease resistance protein RPS2-like [Panicum miliaceum]|uniref:Disease resistance protein RPS2-like n=1 Tax=Panicum miliaceum TaxID=4540 RepID=A0A3L6QDH4_PANMI|nr:disease resistance protein RPS2-like [Panicum miliaceum]